MFRFSRICRATDFRPYLVVLLRLGFSRLDCGILSGLPTRSEGLLSRYGKANGHGGDSPPRGRGWIRMLEACTRRRADQDASSIPVHRPSYGMAPRKESWARRLETRPPS